MKLYKNKEFYIVLILSLISTLPFWIWNIDIYLQKLFYIDGWIYANDFLWKILYDYGPSLGVIITFCSLFLWVGSTFIKKLKIYKKYFAFIFLLMLIGPGIIVNAIFKEYWGRPRPRQIKEFGGKYDYIKPLIKGKFVLSSKSTKMLETEQGAVAWDYFRNIYNIKGSLNSFPAGHASAGYFMIFPFFIYRKRKKKAAYFWLTGGIIYGTLMGIGRMVQGGHFASDVLWAFIFVYLTGLVLEDKILLKSEN